MLYMSSNIDSNIIKTNFSEISKSAFKCKMIIFFIYILSGSNASEASELIHLYLDLLRETPKITMMTKY